MTLTERVNAFVQLGNRLTYLSEDEKKTLFHRANAENPWFTEENCERALQGISIFLDTSVLDRWLAPYTLGNSTKKMVGVAMAGNIPLVGFHDLLCVLISGHQLKAKLSSPDSVLMTFIIEELKKIEPRFASSIFIEERLNKLDAVVATGSDNTARYFEYYFRNVPHLIRKNRSSCAVIMGEESDEELTTLGHDVFDYFGLGCRNVSKVFLPDGFDIKRLMRAWEAFNPIGQHPKYANNYTYQRAILLVNLLPFFDNGVLVFSENTSLVSPIAVVYYEFYQSLADLQNKIDAHADKIQCIVSANGWYRKGVPFGQSQQPQVWDYADNVDTMQFLSGC
ncbi:MAG: acyl-CoA reductase [Flammeovirgaceae bacterium]